MGVWDWRAGLLLARQPLLVSGGIRACFTEDGSCLISTGKEHFKVGEGAVSTTWEKRRRTWHHSTSLPSNWTFYPRCACCRCGASPRPLLHVVFVIRVLRSRPGRRASRNSSGCSTELLCVELCEVDVWTTPEANLNESNVSSLTRKSVELFQLLQSGTFFVTCNSAFSCPPPPPPPPGAARLWASRHPCLRPAHQPLGASTHSPRQGYSYSCGLQAGPSIRA